MEKKVVILVHPGMPYRKTIRYGNQRAKDMGAKILLLSIIHELNASERMSIAVNELGSYATVANAIEQETAQFLENAVQFCLDNGITADSVIARGRIDEIIKSMASDGTTKLVVVPTPTTKKVHHPAFIDAIRQFAHSMLDYDLSCPVVAVLAT